MAICEEVRSLTSWNFLTSKELSYKENELNADLYTFRAYLKSAIELRPATAAELGNRSDSA